MEKIKLLNSFWAKKIWTLYIIFLIIQRQTGVSTSLLVKYRYKWLPLWFLETESITHICFQLVEISCFRIPSSGLRGMFTRPGLFVFETGFYYERPGWPWTCESLQRWSGIALICLASQFIIIKFLNENQTHTLKCKKNKGSNDLKETGNKKKKNDSRKSTVNTMGPFQVQGHSQEHLSATEGLRLNVLQLKEVASR